MAYQDDPTGADSMRDLIKRVRRLEAGSPLGNSSISRGALRILSPEGLIVVGSASVTGTLKGVGKFLWDGIVTLTSTFTAQGTTRFEGDTTQVGPFHVTGATDITGALTAKGMTRFEGDTTQVGAHHVQGNQDITGTLAVKGATTLENSLTLTGANAKIVAGIVSLDNNGTIRSTNALLIVAVGLTTVQNNFYVAKDFSVGGTKAFKIPHPSRPGYSLMHGSTESPVSGTEYWGTDTFTDAGSAVIVLPSYFEALNKATNRAVIISAVGKPFAVGADEIVAGKFTAYGIAGRKFTWSVKAERFGADFPTEAAV